MEEEGPCTSFPDVGETALQLDSQFSLDDQSIGGHQEAVGLGDTEEQSEPARVSLSPKAEHKTSREAEEWEQIEWPTRPITCTSPRFSSAMVQWDMPDPSQETPQLMTDSSLANELDSGGVAGQGSDSSSVYQLQDVSAELFGQEDTEEQDVSDSPLLNSDEWTGNGSEPCDAADVTEPKTREQEYPEHELLDSKYEIIQRADLEGDEDVSVSPAPAEPADETYGVEEIQDPGNDADTFVDVKPEEEQEEVCDQPGGQEDSEGEQTSAPGVETLKYVEEGSEAEEEERVAEEFSDEEGEEAKTAGCVREVEVPAPPQEVEPGITKLLDKLLDLPEPQPLEDSVSSEGEEGLSTPGELQEDLPVHNEGLETCEDVDQNGPEQSEAAVINEEELTQEAENAAMIESTQDSVEATENLEETNHSEQQECDQTALQNGEPEQLKVAETAEPMSAEEAKQLHPPPEMELTTQTIPSENTEQPEGSAQAEEAVRLGDEDSGATEQRQQAEEPPEGAEQSLQTASSSQPAPSEQLPEAEKTNESDVTEQLSPETEVPLQTGGADSSQVEAQATAGPRVGEVGGGDEQRLVANGGQHKAPNPGVPYMNGEVDRDKARRLAEQLFKLDGIHRADVVKHLDKNNAFSHAVGEEYLQFFDFTGQTLDQAIRSFLKVVILIGETQERERVLEHFSCRFHQCNPGSYSSSGSVLALTCALMLLNTDLHGQHVGKPMSSSKFVSNLDSMNDEGNFNKELLKSLYNSIKNEPLQWAVDEEELKNSVLVDEDAGEDAPLRSKSNPFQDVPHDKKACEVKQGFLQRKLHADIDGKRTPWGKRGWKTFYGVLKGMVLYLQKDNYRRDHQSSEEVVSVHHSVAEQAANYTKKPHVFRLQTADWRIFLFQASSKVEMYSWISRINLVSALHSSPPFPAAVGSQRRFCRPILPASQSAHTLERQLQSHAGMLESFKADLLYQEQNPPEGKKAKEDHHIRTEYLHHEVCRYEIYIEVLEAWKSVAGQAIQSKGELSLFDKTVYADTVDDKDEEEGGLKKSHSSPSLELEVAPPTIIKVKRNISERRTYRKTIIPRLNKEV
ncbi:unnamed protein product [Menidia menidia]|uniref:(Atlantic silverside) hypothetical protein n=1 Tax=Menidia menidia TaxID=238744 RepID=A0A8S4AKQ4_9TELE|nr:unnamed protein product [Menidia menidia]